MKKAMMITALACATWAVDFSQMSIEQLIKMRIDKEIDTNERPAFNQEMQNRIKNMTPEERQYYLNRGGGFGGGKNCETNMPNFSEYDLNNDGHITKSEFRSGHEQMVKNKKLQNADDPLSFDNIDADKNGIATQKEFKKHQSKQLRDKCGYTDEEISEIEAVKESQENQAKKNQSLKEQSQKNKSQENQSLKGQSQKSQSQKDQNIKRQNIKK
ncbi:MAG: EF-hand domain-containing protein [Sulfurovaceae bacterium]|nr:EF-hand domain-containing protein [Sulfurovaceae bacterium]